MKKRNQFILTSTALVCALIAGCGGGSGDGGGATAPSPSAPIDGNYKQKILSTIAGDYPLKCLSSANQQTKDAILSISLDGVLRMTGQPAIQLQDTTAVFSISRVVVADPSAPAGTYMLGKSGRLSAGISFAPAGENRYNLKDFYYQNEETGEVNTCAPQAAQSAPMTWQGSGVLSSLFPSSENGKLRCTGAAWAGVRDYSYTINGSLITLVSTPDTRQFDLSSLIAKELFQAPENQTNPQPTDPETFRYTLNQTDGREVVLTKTKGQGITKLSSKSLNPITAINCE